MLMICDISLLEITTLQNKHIFNVKNANLVMYNAVYQHHLRNRCCVF